MAKGGKPRRHEYEDGDLRVGTFQITHKKLIDFQKSCEKSGLSMSEAIHGFIDGVLSGEKELVAPVSDVDRKFAEFDAAIATLREEISELKKLELAA